MRSLRAVVARSGRWVAICSLVGVPVVLAAVYYLTPVAFQQGLVLDHTDPQPHAFWTNVLVHDRRPGDGHLLGNVLGYVLLVVPCWALYRTRGRERTFWIALAVVLGLGPLVTSGSSYAVFHEVLELRVRNDRGFSGVVSALDGFLIVSVVQTFAREQEASLGRLSVGLYVAYLLLGLGVATGRPFVAVVGLVAFGGTFVGVRTGHVAPIDDLLGWAGENRLLAAVLVAAAFVSTLAFAAALPADLTATSGELTNVVAHGTGILFGMVVAVALRPGD